MKIFIHLSARLTVFRSVWQLFLFYFFPLKLFEEHEASTRNFHSSLSLAARFASFHVSPISSSSFFTVERQVAAGRPFFRSASNPAQHEEYDLVTSSLQTI
jgi:hypothetical protein